MSKEEILKVCEQVIGEEKYKAFVAENAPYEEILALTAIAAFLSSDWSEHPGLDAVATALATVMIEYEATN